MSLLQMKAAAKNENEIQMHLRRVCQHFSYFATMSDPKSNQKTLTGKSVKLLRN
uniref:Uncharacterized protein n=1 Tax=Schistosoma japonicum TaxID=6182 RepID=Q5BYK3_SCHJA|nr:unknown [Schistosoma japonicum]